MVENSSYTNMGQYVVDFNINYFKRKHMGYISQDHMKKYARESELDDLFEYRQRRKTSHDKFGLSVAKLGGGAQKGVLM